MVDTCETMNQASKYDRGDGDRGKGTTLFMVMLVKVA